MTIPYNLHVSSTNSFAFLKIIFRWRGSIWKSVMVEFVVWSMCYFAVSVVYRNLPTPEQRRTFEALAAHCDKKLDYIPLTFLLGFFASTVADRWKNMFSNMGFIENAAHFVSSYVRGDDPDTITKRRNMVRYLCLTQVLVLRDISMKVRKRFPNLDSVVEAGFMHPNEKILFEKTNIQYTKYWVPMNWVFALAYQLRTDFKIENDSFMNCMLLEVRNFRQNLENLCNYDWVPVPLAYPQVVFLAVRVYFLICLVARQCIISPSAPNRSILDVYVPFMTMFQFIFYMGWMKVAEALLNPLGEDDDDFEGNYLIDKNITTAMSMVDEAHAQVPEQFRDSFTNDQTPLYSTRSASIPFHALRGSAADVVLEEPVERLRMIPHEAEPADNVSITSLPNLTSAEKTAFNKRRASDNARYNCENVMELGGSYKSENDAGYAEEPQKASCVSTSVTEVPNPLETEKCCLERSKSDKRKENKEEVHKRRLSD